MAHPDDALFRSQRAHTALEKYCAVTHLTVRVYGLDRRLLSEPTHPTPLFRLLVGSGADAALFVDRLRSETVERSSPMVVEQYGLAMVEAAFRLDGEVVYTAVAGPALVAHLSHREFEQIARASGLDFDTVWFAVRKELPVPRERLQLYGELLQVVGETLLSESHRSRLLEEALARLEAADRAKDLFLATLSHELRTPLTSIVGWTRILRTRIRDEANLDRGLEVIDRSARLQVRLIDDLLDVSRAIAGKVDLDLRPVRLAPLIEVVVDAARPAADARQLRLEAALDTSVGSVWGDRDRLGQVVANLLTNAIKFTPPGGRVEVGLRRVDSRAEIRVSDTGEGIAPEFVPRLFERFRQADAGSTRSHGGLGLGLALVKHFAELHGGTVRAESAGENQGATFIVTLPLAVVEGTDAPESPAMSSALRADTLEGIRVLLVEDDPDARELLTVMLRERSADVTAVASAADARKAFIRLQPHVLVSDIGLPGQDGYDLLRTLRGREEPGRQTPAVAVTALSGVEERDRALAAGYQRHFCKPIDAVALTRAIAELARG